MTFDFYQNFLRYNQDQLCEIIINKDAYQEEALKAAWRIAGEKGYADAIQQRLNDKEAADAGLAQDFQNARDIFNDGCYIIVHKSEIIAVESCLAENGIEYFSTERNSMRAGGRFYYFRKDDFDTATTLLGIH